MRVDEPAAVRHICTERLGEENGGRYAALARRGFRLDRPTEHTRATGRCRFGGPALLEPGTAWPELDGHPLALHAVLDTDALAPWLGAELAARPGLLNFFVFDLDGVPYEEYREVDMFGSTSGRVIPAEPARAVERAAPAPARSFPATPVHAAEVVMLPDSWDVTADDVTFDTDTHWGAASLIIEAMGELDGNTADQHCAFGWPDTTYGLRVTGRDADGPHIHLLQLAGDADLGWGWGDAGTLYFTIPVGAFSSGDFSAARLTVNCC